MDFLSHSARAFDKGSTGEAMRMAHVLRLLLCDTSSSHSLLGQLGVKNRLLFVDTASVIDPTNAFPTPGLVMMRFNVEGQSGFEAPLGKGAPPRNKPPKPFDPWWHDPVTKDRAGQFFSRSHYVLRVANQDGGSHVDPALNEEWYTLTRESTLGQWVIGGQEMAISPAYPSVRQITYEVELTITQQLGHLL